MLTDDQGSPIHAPKPQPPSTKDLGIIVTRTTQGECYNLYPGIFWAPEKPDSRYGPCTHYDDSEYRQALADWEEKQAELLEKLRENDL